MLTGTFFHGTFSEERVGATRGIQRHCFVPRLPVAWQPMELKVLEMCPQPGEVQCCTFRLQSPLVFRFGRANHLGRRAVITKYLQFSHTTQEPKVRDRFRSKSAYRRFPPKTAVHRRNDPKSAGAFPPIWHQIGKLKTKVKSKNAQKSE